MCVCVCTVWSVSWLWLFSLMGHIYAAVWLTHHYIDLDLDCRGTEMYFIVVGFKYGFWLLFSWMNWGTQQWAIMWKILESKYVQTWGFKQKKRIDWLLNRCAKGVTWVLPMNVSPTNLFLLCHVVMTQKYWCNEFQLCFSALMYARWDKLSLLTNRVILDVSWWLLVYY